MYSDPFWISPFNLCPWCTPLPSAQFESHPQLGHRLASMDKCIHLFTSVRMFAQAPLGKFSTLKCAPPPPVGFDSPVWVFGSLHRDSEVTVATALLRNNTESCCCFKGKTSQQKRKLWDSGTTQVFWHLGPWNCWRVKIKCHWGVGREMAHCDVTQNRYLPANLRSYLSMF
jgi:hypothetical protein